MAAYAALVCLSNLTMQIQNHPRFSALFDKNQIQYLVEIVELLLDFVESYNEEAQDLEKKIASAAYVAEFVTLKYIEDQFMGGSSEQKSLAYLLRLHKWIVDMDFIKEKVMEVKQNKQPTYSIPAVPSKPLTSGKPTMVGFDDELILLMDLLTSRQGGRKIISIIGMGGMGKTTLAKNVYENLVIMQYFDIRAWATISQVYSVREILVQLLSFMQQKFTCAESVDELGEYLYKSLSGRRYLIVLDDMWNIEVWDEIKFFFPINNGERSRVVITSRLCNVASHCHSSCIMMKFLDEDQSWKLLCEKAFGEEDCPNPELEEIGKEIVKKCNGLPLSIVVIGGHLRNSSRTKEYWLEVGKDINSVLDSGDEDEQCFSILRLSYNHLPTYLKPLFLYIGIRLEVLKEIGVSKLVKICVAEGFIKPSEAQSLEEVAVLYLKDLVDRNLIVVHEWSRNGKMKTCRIHDLLIDLCLMVAKQEMFYRSLCVELYGDITIENELGVVYPPGTKFDELCLRYLHSEINFSTSYYSRPAPCLYLHSFVFLLWNLQTLVINTKENIRIMAPSELWEMLQLRHLLIKPRICVPDPPPSDDLVLHNLHTLLIAENFRLSVEVCKRIPNIKKLKLFYDREVSSGLYYCLHNLCHLKQLKSLTCDFFVIPNWSNSALNLPSSLRKLSLRSRNLDSEDLSMIATMVPHLEVLELEFRDSNLGEFKGEFRFLKSLSIFCQGDFIEWNAEKSHFPVLNNLTLYKYGVDEIPLGFVEIPTLENIELLECSATTAISAMKILVEREELGYEGFQLQLRFNTLYDEERFWEMVKEEDLTSNNVVLKYSFRTKSACRMKTGA